MYMWKLLKFRLLREIIDSKINSQFAIKLLPKALRQAFCMQSNFANTHILKKLKCGCCLFNYSPVKRKSKHIDRNSTLEKNTSLWINCINNLQRKCHSSVKSLIPHFHYNHINTRTLATTPRTNIDYIVLYLFLWHFTSMNSGASYYTAHYKTNTINPP